MEVASVWASLQGYLDTLVHTDPTFVIVRRLVFALRRFIRRAVHRVLLLLLGAEPQQNNASLSTKYILLIWIFFSVQKNPKQISN